MFTATSGSAPTPIPRNRGPHEPRAARNVEISEKVAAEGAKVRQKLRNHYSWTGQTRSTFKSLFPWFYGIVRCHLKNLEATSRCQEIEIEIDHYFISWVSMGIIITSFSIQSSPEISYQLCETLH
jgi:hypothetical protein